MESIPSFYTTPPLKETNLREAILSHDDDKIKNLLDNKEIRSSFLEWANSNSPLLETNLRFKNIVKIAKKKELEGSNQTVTKSFMALGNKIQKIYWKIKQPSPLDTWLDDKNKKMTGGFRDFITSQKGFKSLAAYYDLGLINEQQLKEILFTEFGEDRAEGFTIIHNNPERLRSALPLFEIISEKKPELLKEILTKGAKLEGITPLYLGGFKALLPLFEILANKRPQIIKEIFNSPNTQGKLILFTEENFEATFPLFEILEKGHPEILKEVLCAQEVFSGTTILQADSKNFKTVFHLLEKLTHEHPDLLTEILTTKDKEGDTLLHTSSNFEIAIPLLNILEENNSKALEKVLSVQNNEGNTPLYSRNILDSAFPFLEKLADKEPDILGKLISIQNKNGKTAWHDRKTLEISIEFLEKLTQTHRDIVSNLLTIKDKDGKDISDTFSEIAMTEIEGGDKLVHYPDFFKNAIEFLKVIAENKPSALKNLLSIQNGEGNTPLQFSDTFIETLPLLDILSNKSPDTLIEVFGKENNDKEIPFNVPKILEEVIPFLELLIEKDPILFKRILSIQNSEGKTFMHYKGEFQAIVPLLQEFSKKHPDLFKDLLNIQSHDGTSLHLNLYFDVTDSIFPFIEDQLKQGQLTPIIKVAAQFVSRNYEERLVKLLKAIIENQPTQALPHILSNPSLGKLLLIDARSYLDDLVKRGHVDLQAMPLESKLGLLPLFSPDEIASLAKNTPKDLWETFDKQQLLIEPDNFLVTTENLLLEIKSKFGEAEFGSNDENQSMGIDSATPLLAQIPFSCLAAASQNPKLIPILTGYFDAFPISHRQIIFSLLSPEEALQLSAKSWALPIKDSLLSDATTEQKLYVLNHLSSETSEALANTFHLDILLLNQVEDRCKEWEAAITVLNQRDEDVDLGATYSQLAKSLRNFDQRQGLELNTYLRKLQKLKDDLLKNSDSKELEDKVQQKIDPILAKIETLQKQVKTCKQAFSTLKEPQAQLSSETKIPLTRELVAKTLEDNAPEEFMDPISATLMEKPVLGSDGYIYDKSTAVDLKTSPYTRMPLKIIEFNQDLENPEILANLKDKDEILKKLKDLEILRKNLSDYRRLAKNVKDLSDLEKKIKDFLSDRSM